MKTVMAIAELSCLLVFLLAMIVVIGAIYTGNGALVAHALIVAMIAIFIAMGTTLIRG